MLLLWHVIIRLTLCFHVRFEFHYAERAQILLLLFIEFVGVGACCGATARHAYGRVVFLGGILCVLADGLPLPVFMHAVVEAASFDALQTVLTLCPRRHLRQQVLVFLHLHAEVGLAHLSRFAPFAHLPQYVARNGRGNSILAVDPRLDIL